MSFDKAEFEQIRWTHEQGSMMCWMEDRGKLIKYVDTLEKALRESAEQLRRGAYLAGELSQSWSVTTVTADFQKIRRELNDAYNKACSSLQREVSK